MSEAHTKRYIRPVRDQILVLQDKPKEKVGSLYVPQGARETFEDFGTVIAVGPGRILDNGTVLKPAVEPGDRVLFKRRPASALEGDWPDHLMLRDEDILAVVDE